MTTTDDRRKQFTIAGMMILIVFFGINATALRAGSAYFTTSVAIIALSVASLVAATLLGLHRGAPRRLVALPAVLLGVFLFWMVARDVLTRAFLEGLNS